MYKAKRQGGATSPGSSRSRFLQTPSRTGDGYWYFRGWFDDGTPLGSASNAECRINFIAQSCVTISGAEDGVAPPAPWRRSSPS
jgi:Glycosyl hydrolase 36 superfamily, catalytic domain